MKSLASLAFISTLSTSSLTAAVVYADFNDNSSGGLGSFTAGAGQGGGSGFLAGDVWANTGTIAVISGDLSAPAGTNYAITQGPSTAQSTQGSFTSGRQTTRATATTLGTASDLWFSFLLNQPTNNSRGGITFNQNPSQPGNPRIVATGIDVRLGLGATLQGAGEGASMPLASDTLILGQLQIDASGDETLNIWVNPDVSGGIAGLGAADTSLTENAASLDGGVTRVGIQSYSSDNQGGIVDAFILSDDADPNQAFADVTGVSVIPEPSSLALSFLAALGLLSRRR
jgi:hypothetical protein